MTASIWLPNYPYHKNNRFYQTIDLLNRNQVISKSPAIERDHSVLQSTHSTAVKRQQIHRELSLEGHGPHLRKNCVCSIGYLFRKMLQSDSVCRGKEDFCRTWHAHLYSKPPARPTPHFIKDILGLKSASVDEDTPMTVDKQNQEEIAGVDMSCIRKSKQRAKYKSRVTKGTITEKNTGRTFLSYQLAQL
jgi:hypothetical protein